MLTCLKLLSTLIGISSYPPRVGRFQSIYNIFNFITRNMTITDGREGVFENMNYIFIRLITNIQYISIIKCTFDNGLCY
jgi:hypothetical protein